MEPNVILLNRTIEDEFIRADKIIDEYDSFVRYSYDSSDPQYFEDKDTEFKERLEWVICSLNFTYLSWEKKLVFRDTPNQSGRISRKFKLVKIKKTIFKK